VVAVVFFLLLSVAALTSSISLLEPPTAYLQENHKVERSKASFIAFAAVLILSLLIVFNFGELFGLAITISTRYGQPLLGMALCIYAGWVWNRNSLLGEIKQGDPNAENGVFWKIWPFYVRFVCPVVIALIFINSL
jgi:NSS family neurotransmitter:Na+ symporter